jgi:hypothetical protein
MQTTIEQRIDRAKELLQTVVHATMATVNEDGSPHNTPFMFLHDADLSHIYWGSHPDSQHSKNATRTGQIFVVLYDAIERGGLYIRANDAHMVTGAGLEIALDVHNAVRQSRGRGLLPLSYYSGDSPQRMWSAFIERMWVNGTTRGSDGNIIQDIRTEVTAADLLH